MMSSDCNYVSFDTDKSAHCRICDTGSDHTYFRIREMFFGTREQFDYFECSHCGTIQICDIPANLGRHYPSDYYSFAPARTKSASKIEIALRRRRSDAWLGNDIGIVGRLLARMSRRKETYFEWIENTSLSTNSRIVDVGCGSGARLLKMQRNGFRRLSGLDPFIDETIEYPNGVTVYKRSLADDIGSYDLIMLHHSFEHMPDPVATISDIARCMSPEGRALIRLPIAGNYAWRTYRENWFQLDAPRHLVIPTVRAMRMLAATADLEVERYFFESKSDQFLSSEAYRQDIPLIEQKHLPRRSVDELARLKMLADRLNREEDGDQGGFVLRWKRGKPSVGNASEHGR
ncbi:MAG: class I SAM-dependent methyltransferase [Sulfuricellaceae bacterium]|nr:class I SAM-dependent methyltransferase [Sulfuricellaceae bacterium]